MLTFSEAKTKVNMKKSLFRLTDLLELCLAYSFAFSKPAYGLCKDFGFGCLHPKGFLKNFIDYQPLIVSLFTFIVIVFHYQMLERKRAEIFCRILVGGTVFNIAIRYMLDCISVLILFIFYRLWSISVLVSI